MTDFEGQRSASVQAGDQGIAKSESAGIPAADWLSGPGKLGVFLRYDPDDFGLSAPLEAKSADDSLRARLPVTTFSDPFECKWGRSCTFCSNPIAEGSLMVGLLGGGRGFAGPRTKFRGFCHPECVPLPEAMERLDFTRMTSVAVPG